MLRIKRSVQATYNVQFNFMAAQMVSANGGAAVPADSLESMFISLYLLHLVQLLK